MGTDEVRAAAYVRISSDKEGLRAGVERQREDCADLAAERGWTLLETFEDNDTGAWSGKARPAYQRMLEAIRNGRLDAVVVWHADRLHRHPRELEDFITLCDETGVLLATCTGDLDLGTDDGRFRARIMGAVARKESDDKSRRLKRMHEARAEEGRWSGGGRRAFGYDVVGGRYNRRIEERTNQPAHLVINRAEAKLIRAAARRVLAGASLHSITTDWNARGITTPTGKRWGMTRVRALLLSPQIAGLRIHRRTGMITQGEWAPIISREQHELLKIKLNDPARNPNGKRREPPGPRRYTLTGLVFCSLCGQRMVGNVRRNKGRTYTCSVSSGGCGRIRITANHLEELVAEEVDAEYRFRGTWDLDVLESSGQDASEPTEEERALLQQLQELEARRNTLAENLAAGNDPNLIYRANERVREQIEQTEQRLANHLRREQPPGQDWREVFKAADEFAKRREAGELTPEEIQATHEWARAVVEQILIHPAPNRGARFDPSRVQILWRRPKTKASLAKVAS